MSLNFEKILIVDDHPLVRSSISSILKKKYINSEISEASNGKDALEKMKDNSPCLIIADIDMPIMNGIEFLKTVRGNPTMNPKIILISVHAEKELIIYAKKLNADGYLTKSIEPEQLLYFIEQVEQNDVFVVPPEFYDVLTQEVIIEFNSILSSINLMTERELEVFRMIYNGYKNKDIAEQLYVTIKSVENYKNRIANKLACMDFMLTDLIRDKSHILKYLV